MCETVKTQPKKASGEGKWKTKMNAGEDRAGAAAALQTCGQPNLNIATSCKLGWWLLLVFVSKAG